MTDRIDLQALHDAELAAQENFEKRWQRTHFQPEEPPKFSTRDLGIEFVLTVITGLAAIIQAAMRTGYKFFDQVPDSIIGPLKDHADSTRIAHAKPIRHEPGN